MVEFLPCDREGEFMVRVDELLTLADVGITYADLAMRDMELDKKYVAELVVSNPREWPAILVTKTDRGYALVDGRHRREAIVDKNLEEIKATCRQFANEQEVVLAAFDTNLRHGKRLTQENRSDYVYVLHQYFPKMTQKELAARAHIAQSTVSEAIARREKIEHEKKLATQQAAQQSAQHAVPAGEHKEGAAVPDLELEEQEEEPAAPPPTAITPTEEDRIRKEMQKTTRSMSKEAKKVLDFIMPLDDTEQKRLVIEWLAPETIPERDALLRFARLIEAVLEPQPERKPRRRR